MGLIGPMGALPTVYTEELVGPDARRRAAAGRLPRPVPPPAGRPSSTGRGRSTTCRRSGSKGRQAEPDRAGRRPRSRVHLFDLIGLGLEPLRDRQAFPDASLLVLRRPLRPAAPLGGHARAAAPRVFRATRWRSVVLGTVAPARARAAVADWARRGRTTGLGIDTRRRPQGLGRPEQVPRPGRPLELPPSSVDLFPGGTASERPDGPGPVLRPRRAGLRRSTGSQGRGGPRRAGCLATAARRPSSAATPGSSAASSPATPTTRSSGRGSDRPARTVGWRWPEASAETGHPAAVAPSWRRSRHGRLRRFLFD